MMRLTMAVWWSLALVWLLTSNVGADQPAPGQAAHRVEVKGYGATVEAAKKNAVQEAIRKLQAEARSQHLSHWRPNEAQVRKNLLDGPGRADDEVVIEGIGNAKSWVFDVQVPAADVLERWNEHARRRERSEQRLSIALHGFTGLAFVLGVLVGYVRLDDWTQAQYTRWLRLASAGVVTLGATSWFWLQ